MDISPKPGSSGESTLGQAPVSDAAGLRTGQTQSSLIPERGAWLGKLERHDLRNVWTSESSDFTPWLAQPEGIATLGEALGLRLELEAREKFVGPFRADILCRDLDSEHLVLIENQLERTDHIHLGQLITYASGLDAVTIIWIAARFVEEHRAALDWLNKITDDNVRFFGLELELWRIGDSQPAPKFNVVSKPNEWSHSVAQAAKAIDAADLTDLRLMQRDYWAGLIDRLEAMRGPVAGNKKPQPQGSMSFPTGRSHIYLNAAMLRGSAQIRACLYMTGAEAKAFFMQLQAQKGDIERELGYPLNWEELPEGQDSRISRLLDDADVENRDDWPRQHQWLAERLNEMHRVFARRVATPNISALTCAVDPS